MGRVLRLGLLSASAAILLALAAPSGRAQESGGSFGGSAWEDEAPSGGGPSTGSSDWGASAAPSAPSGDWAAQQQAEQQRADEARRQAEEAAREAERLRREEEARVAAERARKLALPPSARIAELPWPATPAFTPIASPRVAAIDAPLAETTTGDEGWVTTTAPVIGSPSLAVIGPWNAPAGLVCGVPITALLAIVALVLTRKRRDRIARALPSEPRAAASPAWQAPTTMQRMPRASGPAMRLSIAFDWTVRARLQAELAAMATRFDLRTRPGLAAAAQAMAQLLAPLAPAARYVSWELATGDARTWFQTRANDLRARFRAELVRNDAVMSSPEYHAREHEGAGLVVVTILVAGKQPIAPPPARFDLESLEIAIARIAARPAGETVALEVIWSPAAENDRMSSYELEKLYPELQRISAGVGARECLYCHGPFPAELGKCPSCGAPI